MKQVVQFNRIGILKKRPGQPWFPQIRPTYSRRGSTEDNRFPVKAYLEILGIFHFYKEPDQFEVSIKEAKRSGLLNSTKNPSLGKTARLVKIPHILPKIA
ncbi:MAG TPA: hypothetical protein VKM55_00385 [Candidatus Lokiarchaeia archaeon]|nr:hypothetical protein [Candidatus Lokiarchaeia archaeon]